MTKVFDFRKYRFFDITKVKSAGQKIGNRTYWKLYSAENTLRIILYTLLKTQVPEWWENISESMRAKVEKRQDDFKKMMWPHPYGKHGIYFLDLKELGIVALQNTGALSPIIPDLENLIIAIEKVRLPRNYVAHMNFPTKEDTETIDHLHRETIRLVEEWDEISPTMHLEFPI